MEDLPYDILGEIFQYLDTKSLVRASMVCKDWNIAFEMNKRWNIVEWLFDIGAYNDKIDKSDLNFPRE